MCHVQVVRVCMRHVLSHHLASIEFDQHATVCLQLFHRDRKAKVVQEEKLKFKMV